MQDLLNLVFLEFDVLAHDWIVFFNDHFFGHGTGVFLGNVEKPCSGRAFQLNFDSGWFRHGSYP
jgi:hypothetical protein